eukprot:5281917-Pyramimonas_sp.AAC.1
MDICGQGILPVRRYFKHDRMISLRPAHEQARTQCIRSRPGRCCVTAPAPSPLARVVFETRWRK